MTGQDPARYDVPNVRGIVWACVVMWLTSAAGVVLSVWRGDWIAAVYAVSAAVCAAGWWQAAERWATWRAAAEVAIRDLENERRRP